MDFNKSLLSRSGKEPRTASVISPEIQRNAIQQLVGESERALQDNKFKEASRHINLALKLDITNPDLQFMNGLTYHLMGMTGDSSKFELAEQGFRQSLNFDPGNLSAKYQLGLLYMDQRRYSLAQEYFSAVALHRSDDPAVLYNLASSSYYAHDPETAEAALGQLMEIDPGAAKNPNALKARTLSLAAMDDRKGVAEFIKAYRQAVPDGEETKQLERRVAGWQSFYDTDVKVLQAQYGGNNPYGTQDNNPYGAQGTDPYGAQNSNPYGGGAPSATGDQFQEQAAAAKGFVDSSMVVVDVVLIGTQEDVRDSRGINLLNGLQLQFGDPIAGTAGWSMSREKTADRRANGSDASTHTITGLINIPAVTYSLNIANSLNAKNQVLAKPSLVAQTGQTSEFFSGTEILAAAVSGGSGDSVSVQKEVGVKLSVTPEVLPDDMVRLHVVAERTFLTDPSNSVVFEFRLDTTKTNVNSTVTMKFGETLILGGLSERETSKSADGVPGLMEIPIINYLFSQRVEREFERSILILMTPRRPQYTRRAEEDRDKNAEKMSDLERNLERLETRHKDWFTPRPTFNEILENLQGREFFEEFRTGDVNIQSWRYDPKGQEHITVVRKRLLGS